MWPQFCGASRKDSGFEPEELLHPEGDKDLSWVGGERRGEAWWPEGQGESVLGGQLVL